MRVLVTGGRDYEDFDMMRHVLGAMHGITTIIHGAASGADTLAGHWAREAGIPAVECLADWRKHGRAAGPIRNQEMIAIGKPDVCVAFPGGRGTADMVRRARAAGIRIIEVPEQEGPAFRLKCGCTPATPARSDPQERE